MSDNRDVSYALTMRSFPSRGPAALQIGFDFTTTAAIIGDLFLETERGLISNIQSVKIDNSNNGSAFSLQFFGVGALGDTITCPANSVLFSPALIVSEDVPRYVAKSAGGVIVPVTLLNIEMPYFVYSTAAAKAAIVTGVQTNHSGTNTGADLIAIPANAGRLRAVIQNPQANNNSFWIQFGAVATADFHSQEIAPGQEFDTANGPLALTDIHMIGTNLDNFYASEIHT